MYIAYIILADEALASPYSPLHEVENTPGVWYVQPSGYITRTISTRNVGSHTLPHFDV